MNRFTSLVIAVLVVISGTSGAMAQLSPSVVAMEKERLRDAEKKPVTVQFTADDVAAATAIYENNPALAYESDCAAKIAAGCFDLGNHLRNKNGKTAQDAVEEAAAYGRACQLNHPEGCFKFGEIKEQGQGLRVERDPRTALGAFDRSCKLGFGNGCYSAAELFGSTTVPPEQRARQAQVVQALYKAGCDLKNYYSCRAIGIVLPGAAPAMSGSGMTAVTSTTAAQDAEAAFLADSGAAPQLIVNKASDVKSSYTGYLRWDAKKDVAIQNVTSARIDGAVDDYTKKMTGQGYELYIKSYVHPQFSSHKIPLAANYDYMFFSACNENCTNLKASLAYFRSDLNQVFLEAADKGSAATTRWFAFSPDGAKQHTADELYAVSLRALCSTDPCPPGKEAAAQFAVYRQLRTMNIESPASSNSGSVKPAYATLHVFPGAGHKAADELGIRLTARSPQIEAAVETQTKKMAVQGYVIDGKSYIVRRYVDQIGSIFKVPLNSGSDYVFFAACNEPCKNLYMTTWSPEGEMNFLYPADKANSALSRSIMYKPAQNELRSVQVITRCVVNDNDECPDDTDAGSQLVVYRRMQSDNIAVPRRP